MHLRCVSVFNTSLEGTICLETSELWHFCMTSWRAEFTLLQSSPASCLAFPAATSPHPNAGRRGRSALSGVMDKARSVLRCQSVLWSEWDVLKVSQFASSMYTDSHEQWQLPDLHSLTKILNYTDIKVLISRYFTLFLLYWCYSYMNTSQFQLGPGFCHLILNPQELVPCVHIFRNRPMQMTVLKLHRCLAE